MIVKGLKRLLRSIKYILISFHIIRLWCLFVARQEETQEFEVEMIQNV